MVFNFFQSKSKLVSWVWRQVSDIKSVFYTEPEATRPFYCCGMISSINLLHMARNVLTEKTRPPLVQSFTVFAITELDEGNNVFTQPAISTRGYELLPPQCCLLAGGMWITCDSSHVTLSATGPGSRMTPRGVSVFLQCTFRSFTPKTGVQQTKWRASLTQHVDSVQSRHTEAR